MPRPLNRSLANKRRRISGIRVAKRQLAPHNPDLLKASATGYFFMHHGGNYIEGRKKFTSQQLLANGHPPEKLLAQGAPVREVGRWSGYSTRRIAAAQNMINRKVKSAATRYARRKRMKRK